MKFKLLPVEKIYSIKTEVVGMVCRSELVQDTHLLTKALPYKTGEHLLPEEILPLP